ncbi:MAG: hypothetical protein GOV00_02190 [Candidatus Altiarchaeota archaeon]|nr:hypothetical protein [Candidatus Altiarchaeota archaeon]
MVSTDTVFDFLNDVEQNGDCGVPVVMVATADERVAYVEFMTDEVASTEMRRKFELEAAESIAAHGLTKVLFIDKLMGALSEYTSEPRVVVFRRPEETRYFGKAQRGELGVYVEVLDLEKNEALSLEVYNELGVLEHFKYTDAFMQDIIPLGNKMLDELGRYTGDADGFCEYILHLRNEVIIDLEAERIDFSEDYR